MVVSLKQKNFRMLWLGSVTEHFGEFMEIAAILWVVELISGSPLMLTIVGASRFIAMIFFPIAGGMIADRFNRRSLLIGALLSSAVLGTVLLLLIITKTVAIWHIIVISLFYGVVTSFNHPARHSILPNLVQKGHLLNAIALDSISVQSSRILAMPLSGYLLASLGVWPIFVIKILGCFMAAFWLLQVDVPPTPISSRHSSAVENLYEGFRYLRGHTIILVLVLLYLIPRIVMNTYTNFLPIYASDVLRIGVVGYGYLQAAPGLGALMSLLGLTMLTYYKGKAKLLIGMGIIMGAGMISLAASHWFVISIFSLIVIGAMQMAFNTVNSTLIQSMVSDEIRGRIMSLREIAFGLGPAGSILFGAIAQNTGVPASTGLLGVICILVSLLLVVFLSKFDKIQ